ncbi:MAG: GSCFA domain-containing protein [Saprospiraceae bacterium]|nr:GSCFA domain-containing protein [Saprospiraceae bacterium]
MNFRSPLILNPSSLQIHYNSNILSIGSCFAENIAHKLTELKYNLLPNPAGICFNPVSILHTIKRSIIGDSLPESEFIESQDLWCHHDFHGSFNHPDKKACMLAVNDSINESHLFLKNVDRVIITLGTAYVYALDNEIVNNCHKRPQSMFTRRRLNPVEIREALNEAIEILDAFSTRDIKYILTLSPVRHLKDGMVENNISKASCLIAMHDVVQSHNHVQYFPAYELLMDDLRDYRFYAKDRIHPSDEAIDYVFHKFQETHLDEKDKGLRNKVYKLKQALNHKPFNPDSAQYEAFKQDLLTKMSHLEQTHSFMNFSEEKLNLRS